MQVLPLMVGNLGDGVCCFQDWISSRPGFVRDVMLVRMLYFVGRTAKGEFASQGSRNPDSGLKAPGIGCTAKPRGKENRSVGGRDRRLAIAISDGSEYREGRRTPDRCVAVVIIVVCRVARGENASKLGTK